MNILKKLQQLETPTKRCSLKRRSKILRSLERLQIQAKSFKKNLEERIFGKAACT